MTTVRLFSTSAMGRVTTAGGVLLAVALAAAGNRAAAQAPHRHWLHPSAMPPGAIGSLRLLRGGPLSAGCPQVIELMGPEGVAIAAAMQGGFSEPRSPSLLVGVLQGPVYRFQVTGVPNHPEAVLYPTVEVIDRTHPPQGLELRFPIPIELTAEELKLAANGAFVTRVIYVEDPTQAAAGSFKDGQNWFEARPCDDPLVVADTLGRPVAILRIGSRGPEPGSAALAACPPVQLLEKPADALPAPDAAPQQGDAWVTPAGLVTDANPPGARTP